MVKLIVAFIVARRVLLLELAGAAAIVGGAAARFGDGIAWMIGGAFALVKAFELDLTRDDGGGS